MTQTAQSLSSIYNQNQDLLDPTFCDKELFSKFCCSYLVSNSTLILSESTH